MRHGWRAAELRACTTNVIAVTATDLEELDAAIRGVVRSRLRLVDIGPATFPLGHLAERLRRIAGELASGFGYGVIRGLPVHRYDIDETAAMLCGIGSYIGRLVPQDSAGSFVHHVVAEPSASSDDASVRGHRIGAALPFHSDSCDVAALLCVSAAESGGRSTVCSSHAVHDALAREHPDALRVLHLPFHIDRHGEHAPGAQPYYSTPVFMWHDGRLFSRFNPGYVHTAQRYSQTPRLTDDQVDAMDAFHRTCMLPDMHYDSELRPGDLQLLNNNVTVHARFAYSDSPNHRRHLLRAWILNSRIDDIPEPMRERYRDLESWRVNAC